MQSMSLPKTLATLRLERLTNHVYSLYAFFPAEIVPLSIKLSLLDMILTRVSHPLWLAIVALFLGLSPVSIHLVPHSRRPTFPVTIPVTRSLHHPKIRDKFGEMHTRQAREDSPGELLNKVNSVQSSEIAMM